MRRAWWVGLWVLVASPALGQSEQALRDAFEGKTVRVKIDMPATSAGIEIHPQQKPAIDFRRLGHLMKREGTSVHNGEAIIVTKVKARKNYIEFQLGGGGYGTLGDKLNDSSESDAHTIDKTNREKTLEDQIRATSDRSKKKALERELRDTRNERESRNARAQSEANQANQLRDLNVQQAKLRGGSRFTLRFAGDLTPAEYLTPDGLQNALAEWVDFGDEPEAPAAVSAAPSGSSAHSLHKGLSLEQVERILGPASASTEKREGSLVVLERTYRRGSETIVTRFVDDVLVKYSISSD